MRFEEKSTIESEEEEVSSDMFKKNPYIFFKELINNSYSEHLTESVTII